MKKYLKNTKRLSLISILLSILFMFCGTLFVTQIYGQGTPVQVQLSNDKNPALQWLPVITFLLSVIVGILNLWVINKLNKSKDEILGIVRTEFNEKINHLDNKTATKEQVDFLRTEMGLMFRNIEQKIESSREKR